MASRVPVAGGSDARGLRSGATEGAADRRPRATVAVADSDTDGPSVIATSIRHRADVVAKVTDHAKGPRVLARQPFDEVVEASRMLESASALMQRAVGTARELVNVLERAVILSHGHVLMPEHLPDRLFAPAPRPSASTPPSKLSLEELERQHIERVVAESETLEEAATRLGINPTTLWRKRKRYRLEAAMADGVSGHRSAERRIRQHHAPGKRSSGSGSGPLD